MSPRGRTGAAAALWRALRRGRRRGAPRTSVLLRAVPRLVGATLTGRYPGLSRGRLLLMAAAAAYILSPIDLLPEGLLGPIGLADDAAVMAWLAGALLSEGEAFLAWERDGGAAGPPGARATREETRWEAPRGADPRAGWRADPHDDHRDHRDHRDHDVVPGEVIR